MTTMKTKRKKKKGQPPAAGQTDRTRFTEKDAGRRIQFSRCRHGCRRVQTRRFCNTECPSPRFSYSTQVVLLLETLHPIPEFTLRTFVSERYDVNRTNIHGANSTLVHCSVLLLLPIKAGPQTYQTVFKRHPFGSTAPHNLSLEDWLMHKKAPLKRMSSGSQHDQRN